MQEAWRLRGTGGPCGAAALPQAEVFACRCRQNWFMKWSPFSAQIHPWGLPELSCGRQWPTIVGAGAYKGRLVSAATNSTAPWASKVSLKAHLHKKIKKTSDIFLWQKQEWKHQPVTGRRDSPSGKCPFSAQHLAQHWTQAVLRSLGNSILKEILHS